MRFCDILSLYFGISDRVSEIYLHESDRRLAALQKKPQTAHRHFRIPPARHCAAMEGVRPISGLLSVGVGRLKCSISAVGPATPVVSRLPPRDSAAQRAPPAVSGQFAGLWRGTEPRPGSEGVNDMKLELFQFLLVTTSELPAGVQHCFLW